MTSTQFPMTNPTTVDDEVLFLPTDPAPSTPTIKAPAGAPPKRKRKRRASARALANSVGVIVGYTASGKQVGGVLAGDRFLLLVLPTHELITVDEVVFRTKFEGCKLQQIKAKIEQQMKERSTGEI